jgi:hypothetical protein
VSELLDMAQILCKYYVDISRYRDATGFIRESLDITQLHFSKNRLAVFLMHQINCDLLANCHNEATSRLQVVGNLIRGSSEKNTTTVMMETAAVSSHKEQDLFEIKNMLYFIYSSMFKEIKKPDAGLDVGEFLQEKLQLASRLINTSRACKDYAKDVFIDICFLIVNYQLKATATLSKSSKLQVLDLLKLIKSYLFITPGSSSNAETSGGDLALFKEKWHLSEYYCCLFELDETNYREYIHHAFLYIKKNPAPSLYRRICMNLFRIESDARKRILYLLETQSIALRHKACSIQLKHKRKSTIDLKSFETLIQALSFANSFNREYLNNFLSKILPSDCVVISLMLSEQDDLYLIRIEKACEPLLVRLKLSRSYVDEFKVIMVENDKSMKILDRNKFWSNRNALNKKLNKFLDDLENRVFAHHKSHLLGSFVELSLDAFVSKFKAHFGIESLSADKCEFLKTILLGLEFFSDEELLEAFRCESFEKTNDPKIINEYISYLVTHVKPKLSDAKRKHVCLLVDKVIKTTTVAVATDRPVKTKLFFSVL